MTPDERNKEMPHTVILEGREKDVYKRQELSILMTRLEPQLRAHAEALAGADLAPVGAMLGQVEPIDYADLIPADSLLHEFIG